MSDKKLDRVVDEYTTACLEIQRLELALSVEQAQTKYLTDELQKANERIVSMHSRYGELMALCDSKEDTITEQEQQLSKFKDCVPVPKDVYSHIRSQLETLTTAYVPPDMREQFLKASEVK